MQAVNYFIAQKYVETLHAIGTSSSSKLVMIPLEASSIAGTIAGIGEIVREAMGPSAAKPAGKSPWAPSA